MKPCWMASGQPEVFVHLGKFGDEMILLPALKAIHDATGIPPVVYVTNPFDTIFDGVSYAMPRLVPNLVWWRDCDRACALAFAEHGHCTLPKWWDLPHGALRLKAGEPTHLKETEPLVNLKIRGQWHTIPAKHWDSYQSSQWRSAGFTMQQFWDWPLVFDRRSPEREAELRRLHFHTDKPRLLVNLYTGGTSPFPFVPEVMPWLRESGAEIVNLENVRAERIYDLLGLYDHADGLITSDTATLHLAGASKIPYIAFINNGGAGSIPKGNCVLTVRYARATQSKTALVSALNNLSWGLYAPKNLQVRNSSPALAA